VQRYRFRWKERSFAVSLSIGLVPITGVWKSSTIVLQAADIACYKAKDLGRNQVYVQGPEDPAAV
jgi:Amt family ammonium transporter